LRLPWRFTGNSNPVPSKPFFVLSSISCTALFSVRSYYAFCPIFCLVPVFYKVCNSVMTLFCFFNFIIWRYVFIVLHAYISFVLICFLTYSMSLSITTLN
jgi:hypothetical protein